MDWITCPSVHVFFSCTVTHFTQRTSLVFPPATSSDCVTSSLIRKALTLTHDPDHPFYRHFTHRHPSQHTHLHAKRALNKWPPLKLLDILYVGCEDCQSMFVSQLGIKYPCKPWQGISFFKTNKLVSRVMPTKHRGVLAVSLNWRQSPLIVCVTMSFSFTYLTNHFIPANAPILQHLR